MNDYINSKMLPTSDPVSMGGLTVQAVGQIGTAAEDKIEAAAQAIEADAARIAAQLRELAKKIHERSRIAGAHVEEFVNQSTSILETMRLLQDQLGRDNL